MLSVALDSSHLHFRRFGVELIIVRARPIDYGIFGANDDTNIREKKILIFDMLASIVYIISVECGYQIHMTKICNGGRISYILTNFILNISALNSKPFTN